MAYAPLFVAAKNSLSSRLTLHNLESFAATVEVFFYNASGALLYTYPTSLPAHNAKYLDRVSMNLPSTLTQASAVVQSNGNIYAGIDRLYAGALAAAHAPAQGGIRLVAPMFIANYQGFSSTFSVQNINKVSAQVQLYYYKYDGSLLSTTVRTLAPYAAFNWQGIDLPPATYGQVIAMASQPVVAVVEGNRTIPPYGLADYTVPVVTAQPADRLDRTVAYGPILLSNEDNWLSTIFIANFSPINTATVHLEISATPTGTLFPMNTSVPPLHVHVMPLPMLPPVFRRSALRLTADYPIAAAIMMTSTSTSVADNFMAYEAQYTLPVFKWNVFLPLILK